jgi:hypothetical protein
MELDINFLVEEIPTESSDIDLKQLMNELWLDTSNDELTISYEEFYSKYTISYEEFYSKYTIKELMRICKYYNIESHIRLTKCKKNDIITNIIYFESLPENDEITKQRQLMWHYIAKLQEDPKMKQYIIWN